MTSDKKKVNYQSGEDKLTNTKYSKQISQELYGRR